jgi:N utilization substance protein B
MGSRISSRRSSRELALRALYQIDVGGTSPAEATASVCDSERYSESALSFARELVLGTSANLARIDDIIEENSRGWSLSRMASVDRNILRLAIFELLFLPDIPASVTVDEAVELAKKYSTAESGRFVNGVLGNIVKHLDQELPQP